MQNLVHESYLSVVKDWRLKNIVTRSQLASELDQYCVYFAYNSGRIENPEITYHDTRNVFENGRAVAFTGNVRTLFEIQNQKDCHEFLLDAFSRKEPITTQFVLDVHETLVKGTYDEVRWGKGERPGAFKIHDYVVGVGETGIPAADVPREIDDLVVQLSLATEENILTVAAFFHANFESIHPFADGNGRAGRALTNYLLILYNHPPIIIYDEDKLSYYGALEQWDADANLGPMKEFLEVETIKTWSSERD